MILTMPFEPFSEDARRAEYAVRMNRAVDYIQAHLAEPLDLEILAEVACFSPFHFHRLFHGLMGETIHDFIHRLRLERAAAQLVYAPGKSITEIALDCGFSSSSTFARAFKAFHHQSASEWRKNRKTDRKNRKDGSSEPVASSGEHPSRNQAPPMTLNIEVRHLPPMNVAYLRHVGPFQGNAALFSRLFGRLAAWARPRGFLLLSTARFLSVHHDNPEMEITDERNLRLDVALTVPGDIPVEGGISRQRLEGGAYAVARLRIRVDQYMEAWDAFMRDWLPASGYQPDVRPCLEIHHNEPHADLEGLHDVELCLAVKPL